MNREGKASQIFFSFFFLIQLSMMLILHNQLILQLIILQNILLFSLLTGDRNWKDFFLLKHHLLTCHANSYFFFIFLLTVNKNILKDCLIYF